MKKTLLVFLFVSFHNYIQSVPRPVLKVVQAIRFLKSNWVKQTTTVFEGKKRQSRVVIRYPQENSAQNNSKNKSQKEENK